MNSCFDLDGLLANAMLDTNALQHLILSTANTPMPYPEVQRNIILAAIRELHAKGRPVNIVTFFEVLESKDSGVRLEELASMVTAPLLDPLYADELCIRPFLANDIPAYVEAVHESAPTVGRSLPWCSPSCSAVDAIKWISACRDRRLGGTAYDLGIFSRDCTTLHGSVAINRIDPDQGMSNLGYWVRSSRQRQDIAGHASCRMVDFAFNELHLSRIEIAAAEDNLPSRRVAEKLGAKLHGIFTIHRIITSGNARAAAVYELQRPSSKIPWLLNFRDK